jgi:RNA polymerase sigma-70 factor (ECF subfamily)
MSHPPPTVQVIGLDPDAFEAFYRCHVDDVQRFIARRVRDPHVAADLTADVFVAVIEASAGYRPELGSPIAWVFGVARNVVADRERSVARELRAVSRVSGRALLDADSLRRVEERVDAARDARALYEVLATLPGDDRALLELVALDGISPTDAARVLGVKPVTARVRLHRARRQIITRLETAGLSAPASPHLAEASS